MRAVPRIVAALTDLAKDPEKARCPVCKTRWVHTRQPDPGKTWPPFLSCSGSDMLVRIKGKSDFACRGKSKSLRPVVVY